MREIGTLVCWATFKDHLLEEGMDEQHIIEIAFDSFENKRFRAPALLYPYLKAQMTGDGM